MEKTTGPADYIESLVVWIREKPSSYASLSGELDSALWYLHMAWAKVADREAEYDAILRAALPRNLLRDIITQDDRHLPVDLDNEATQKVLKFWAQIDKKLELKPRVESWQP